MEPMKPDLKKNVLAANPQAAPEEIEEYERLLSLRYAQDPDSAAEPPSAASPETIEARLAQLYKKLFSGFNVEFEGSGKTAAATIVKEEIR